MQKLTAHRKMKAQGSVRFQNHRHNASELRARDSGRSREFGPGGTGTYKHKCKTSEGHCRFRCGWGAFTIEEVRVREVEKAWHSLSWVVRGSEPQFMVGVLAFRAEVRKSSL